MIFFLDYIITYNNIMSSDILCNLLNEFYHDIRPDLADSVFSAIRAAQTVNEFSNRPEIFQALRRLIINLSNPQQDDSMAINLYMSNPSTHGSVTRPFFYNMTLRGNLTPEDNPIYPPAPPALGELRPSRAFDPYRDGLSLEQRAELFLSQPPSNLYDMPYMPPPMPSLSSFIIPQSIPLLQSSFHSSLPLPDSLPPIESYHQLSPVLSVVPPPSSVFIPDILGIPGHIVYHN